eukprot:gene1461-1695_t
MEDVELGRDIALCATVDIDIRVQRDTNAQVDPDQWDAKQMIIALAKPTLLLSCVHVPADKSCIHFRVQVAALECAAVVRRLADKRVTFKGVSGYYRITVATETAAAAKNGDSSITPSDTLVMSLIPIKWFAFEKVMTPSVEAVKETFSVIGDIAQLEILDIGAVTFTVAVRFASVEEAQRAYGSMAGRKIKTGMTMHTYDVAYDREEYFSDVSVRKRREAREREQRVAREAEERRVREEKRQEKLEQEARLEAIRVEELRRKALEAEREARRRAQEEEDAKRLQELLEEEHKRKLEKEERRRERLAAKQAEREAEERHLQELKRAQEQEQIRVAEERRLAQERLLEERQEEEEDKMRPLPSPRDDDYQDEDEMVERKKQQVKGWIDKVQTMIGDRMTELKARSGDRHSKQFKMRWQLEKGSRDTEFKWYTDRELELSKTPISNHSQQPKSTIVPTEAYLKPSGLSAEALVERVTSEAADIEDRKLAVRQLTSMGKSAFQVSGSNIPAIIKFLDAHKSDVEVFLGDKLHFTVICDLLSVPDYYVRYYIATFLKTMLANRFESVQEAILLCPMSTTNIMALVTDSRDMIRNEALLVLLELTKSNAEIQKIVAFEGAFDTILEIVRREGQSEGGVVVSDCLAILNNLLRGNVSNQNFFRETGTIPRLAPLLQVQNTDMWILSDNKYNIIMATLDLILALVARNNPSTPPNQHQIATCSMMNLVIRLGLGKMSSPVVRAKALYTLGEIIHMHPENIVEFSAVSMKSEATGVSQSALLRLTQVLLYSKDLIEKMAASHVFKCYLSGNEEAQMGLASTITPQMLAAPAPGSAASGPDDELSIGQHLVRSLFAWETAGNNKVDVASFWFASVILSFTLRDSPHAKDMLLKSVVELPKEADHPPTTLLSKLMAALVASKRLDIDPMIKIGLLKLLATWLAESSRVTKELLSNPANLSLIVEAIMQPPSGALSVHVQGLYTLVLGLVAHYLGDDSTSDRSNLAALINHRIGLNSFKDKLDQLRKSDPFNVAEQGDEAFTMEVDKASIALYDFDFTLFFKDTYDKIRHIGSNVHKPKPGTRPPSANSIHGASPSGQSSPPISSPNTPQPPPRDPHADQIQKAHQLQLESQENEELIAKVTQLESKGAEVDHTIQTLRAEIALLQESAKKKTVSSPTRDSSTQQGGLMLAKVEGELQELKLKYAALQRDQDEMMDWSTKVEVENSALKAQLSAK